MNKEREIVIWLAGLLSTDGTIWAFNPIKENNIPLSFTISTSEKEWVIQIQNKLDEIGLKTNIHKRKNRPNSFTIYLKNPRKIKSLLLKHAKDYLMERKLNIIKKGYQKEIKYYNNLSERKRWSLYEEELLLKTINSLNNKKSAYEQVSKEINRSIGARRRKYYSLNKQKI